LVQGVLQVNVVVPMGTPVGPAVPVVVTVGGGETAPGAVVAVQ
jgi:uncharacterized protein (TIGR03437 family)